MLREDQIRTTKPDITFMVGDWLRFNGLAGQAEGLLYMKVEYITDWGDVIMARYDKDGVRYEPKSEYERNARPIPLPTALAMVEHGILVFVEKVGG